MAEQDKSILELVFAAIRDSHHHRSLPELIGKALGKRAALILLIDVVGSVTTTGDNELGSIRDRSMILQITELLRDNMDRMMQKAGEEAKKAEQGDGGG